MITFSQFPVNFDTSALVITHKLEIKINEVLPWKNRGAFLNSGILVYEHHSF